MRKHSSGSSEDDDVSLVEPPTDASLRLHAEEPRLSAKPATKLDRRRSLDRRPSFSVSRRSSSANWRSPESRNGQGEKLPAAGRTAPSSPLGLILAPTGELQPKGTKKAPETRLAGRRPQWRSPWAVGVLGLLTSIVGLGFLLTVLHSSVTRQLDPKGCRMSYMRPSYAKLNEFDTEHTRLASKYSLYLYREQGVDHDTKV
jgi:hypothetical protein